MQLSDLQILTFAIVIAAAIVIILLERIFPYNKDHKLFRDGIFIDFIFYNGLQNFILGLIISQLIHFIDSSTNISRLHIISGWSVSLQLTFFIVTHDFYIYWFHRWQHHNAVLWRIHEAHHSNKSIDWLAGSRSHAFEILINQTVEFAPIVLLGAVPQVALYKGAVSAVWGMYIHSNINVHSGFLQYFINGPEMHRWHHSDEGTEERNKNFSTKLAVWDWLFGTAYFPKDRKAYVYGLGYFFPKNYLKQLLFAFRKFREE